MLRKFRRLSFGCLSSDEKAKTENGDMSRYVATCRHYVAAFVTCLHEKTKTRQDIEVVRHVVTCLETFLAKDRTRGINRERAGGHGIDPIAPSF